MRFIIGFLIAIGLLIFVFVLIFRGGGSSSSTTTTGTKLVDYANSSSVEMKFTEEGPVEADQTHDVVTITVGSNDATIDVYQGYQQTPVRSKSYPSNSTAYADFLRALELTGYNKGSSDKSIADERGVCATGRRYVFEIQDGSRDIQRYWTSTCGGGSYKGKAVSTRALFMRQIPDYSSLTNDIFGY